MVAVYCLCLTNNRTSLVNQSNNNKEFSEPKVCGGFKGLFNSLPLALRFLKKKTTHSTKYPYG